MLVLTRRENEKIVFPDLGVTVEIIALSGSRARIGIDAPRSVRILRHEIADAAGIQPATKPQIPLSHELRNRLNTISVAARLASRQLAAGEIHEADEALQLILAELSEMNREAASQRVQRPQPRPASRKCTALLVDDDINERRLLEGYLRMTGFDVQVAGDGADALDYLREHDRPDVVLLDMIMPRCDGPSALTQIRQDPRLAGLKIFAVSGTSPSRLGVETGPRGIDEWFEKPIDPEELVRAMQRAMPANADVP